MSRYSSISRRGLYRSRNGVIFGVFKGLAEYFNFSVCWLRAIAVLALIFTGFWPIIGIYILAALLMKSDPALRDKQGTRHGFDCHFAFAKHDAADRIKRKWQHLERRIRRMEDKAI
ncbi:MAG: PspC domain-containing protein [Deltaproteobacteria bacterium]|nr:PspC domain-containing protein [Deltaproteobacteria bacterium]